MVISLLKPSYKAGFARNASESANPHLWRGLVGAWIPALGVTGNTLFDVSGRGNNGINNGATWLPRGQLSFNGIDNYFILTSGINFGSIDFSFSFRLKTTDSGSGKIFGTVSDGTNTIFQPSVNTNQLGSPSAGKTFFGIRSEQGRTRNVAISANIYDGTFHDIIFTRTGATTTVYVDGVSQTLTVGVSSLQAGDTLTTQYPLTFAAQNVRGVVQRFSDIILDDILIYKRELLPTEAKQLHIDSLAPFRLRDRITGRSIVAVPDFVDFIFGAMTQSSLASTTMTQPRLSGVTLTQSTLADVALVS